MVDTLSWMVDIPPRPWMLSVPNQTALHFTINCWRTLVENFITQTLVLISPQRGTLTSTTLLFWPLCATFCHFLALPLFFAFHTQSVTWTFPHFWQPVKNWNYWLALHRTFYWPTWLTFGSNGPFQIMSTYSCRFPALRPAGSSNQGQQDIDFSNNPCLDGPKVCS